MDNLFENTYYIVTTGTLFTESGREILGYQAKSKRTGVVEYEDTVLPQVIEFAKGANNHLSGIYTDNVVAIDARLN